MHNHLAVQLYITAFNIENLHGYVPQRWENFGVCVNVHNLCLWHAT